MGDAEDRSQPVDGGFGDAAGTLLGVLSHLLRPWAILSHVIVLTVVVVCVLLGQWQLDRLGEVRASNARLESRLTAEPLVVTALDRVELDEEALEYRRATAVGVYRAEEEVLQRNRSLQGRQGFHVLTPLELRDGRVLLVRRGWVPAELDQPPVPEAAPPSGTVEVTGLLERPVEQPSFGARDPADGVLERVFHADTGRLDRQVEGELVPMVLRLETQEPPLGGQPGELPVPLERPVLSEANHLSYAVQWHSFALIAAITYGAWWWSRLRRSPRAAPDHAPPLEHARP